MTDYAAIAGTLSDVKLIKSRSVLQLVVEVAIEQADAALSALGGVPQPGRERPVMVALFNPDAVVTSGPLVPTASDPHAAHDAPPPEQTPKAPAKQRTAGAASSQDRVVQRCAILCGEKQFQDWLYMLPGSDGRQQYEDMHEWVAREVRHRCGVKSRRDLAINGEGRKRWLALELEYKQAHGLAAVDHSRRSA